MQALVSLNRSQLFHQVLDAFVHISLNIFGTDYRVSLTQDLTTLELRRPAGTKLTLSLGLSPGVVVTTLVLATGVVRVETRFKIVFCIFIILRWVCHLFNFTLPIILLLLIELVE